MKDLKRSIFESLIGITLEFFAQKIIRGNESLWKCYICKKGNFFINLKRKSSKIVEVILLSSVD